MINVRSDRPWILVLAATLVLSSGWSGEYDHLTDDELKQLAEQQVKDPGVIKEVAAGEPAYGKTTDFGRRNLSLKYTPAYKELRRRADRRVLETFHWLEAKLNVKIGTLSRKEYEAHLRALALKTMNDRQRNCWEAFLSAKSRDDFRRKILSRFGEEGMDLSFPNLGAVIVKTLGPWNRSGQFLFRDVSIP